MINTSPENVEHIRLICVPVNCDYSIMFDFVFNFFFFTFYHRSSQRFAVDVVGTVSFGLDVNTIDDASHEFRMIEKTVNNGEFVNSIRTVGTFLCPE